MASTKMAITNSSQFLPFRVTNNLTCRRFPVQVISTRFASPKQDLYRSVRLIKEGQKGYPGPLSAAGSGVEASVADPKALVNVKNATIVVESEVDDKIEVRVDIPGDDTQIVFDKVLASLARTAPPVPGFRKQKGGHTSNVPKSFLLQILGEERVTTFVIQEIVNSTLADYVTKGNLKVKENKVNTTQSKEELKSSFKPGKAFGFNATIDLDKAETESSSSSSETTESSSSSSET